MEDAGRQSTHGAPTQVAGIIHWNICAEFGLEVPGSRWETPPKVIANEPVKILWDFQIQRTAVVVDAAIPSDGNIRRKEHEKLEKYQGLKEELEKM